MLETADCIVLKVQTWCARLLLTTIKLIFCNNNFFTARMITMSIAMTADMQSDKVNRQIYSYSWKMML